MLGTTEIVLIVIAVLVLFGGKKIPELARGVGTSFKEFKDAMSGVEKDATKSKKTDKSKKKSKSKK